MKPSRELDALVAEKVMGLNIDEHCVHTTEGRLPCFPHYSTDIAAAWEVADKIGISVIRLTDGFLAWYGFKPDVGGMLEIHIYPNGERPEWEYQIGDTAPHAISLTALKTVGHRWTFKKNEPNLMVISDG